MRIRTEVSTLRRPEGPWGTATDAPTHLPADEVVVRRATSDSVMTSAPKSRPSQESLAQRASQESASQSKTVQRPSAASVRDLSEAKLESSRGYLDPGAVSGNPSAVSGGAPDAKPLARGSAPAVGALPPFVAFEGGASFDPLALPLPPELAPMLYDWLRRLALQADLAGADRLLRDALADLTSSLSAVLIYKGPDGLYTLGAGDELPKDQTPVVAVAKSRRAIVSTHSAFIPICTSTDTVAVIQLVRNARQNPFSMVEYVTMAGVARECASIMLHLVAQDAERRIEAEHDKKGLYRAEALQSHRTRGTEGVVTELSPGWIKRTYQVLLVAIVIAAAFAYFIHVPTYSTGVGIVVFDGTPIVSPVPGTVDTIYVDSAARVAKGTPLIKLKADKEEADLAQARSELQAAKQQYLIDSSDETLRKTLISAQAATKRAEDALEQKTVRATKEGTVSDIRIRIGSPLEFGAPILTIVAPGTEPELWAYLPGGDRPRLQPKQTLQVELTGYQKTREAAEIYSVGRNVIGAAEARRSLGGDVADALKLAPEGSYVLVKAKLPARTFKARGRMYRYHSGMPAKTEVRVESKRFVVTLLPSLEKYIE